MSWRKPPVLAGQVLNADEGELEELIGLIERHPSVTSWVADWMNGEHKTIADVHDHMRTVPATPSAVIAYLKVMFSE